MSNNSNKKTSFWISYSDLMTSLFFTMLVLFVVFVVAFGHANKELRGTSGELDTALGELEEALNKANASKEQLESILHIQEQFQSLTESSHLDYDAGKSVFYVKDFMGIEIFEPDKDVIKSKYLSTVDEVGKEIKEILDSLSKNNFKFQLVIEGTAAIPYNRLKSKTYDPDNKEIYILSYKRALALYNRWKKLNLRDNNTEIIIAGSGFNGINRDMENEDNNKRFVIQIIPKIDRPAISEMEISSSVSADTPARTKNGKKER